MPAALLLLLVIHYIQAQYNAAAAPASSTSCAPLLHLAPTVCYVLHVVLHRRVQAVRNEQYHNYYNLEEAVSAAQPAIDSAAVKPRPGARLFDFYRCAACMW